MKFNILALTFSLIFSAHSMSPVQDRVAFDMRLAAQNLSKSLSAKQLKKLMHEKKKRWDYLPTFRLGIRRRKGITLKKLNDEQIKKVWGLLESGMSLMGMETIKFIRVLEANHKKNPGFARIAVKYDPMLYYISIYGDPNSPNWAWRFEGHHLSLNFTIKNGSVLSRSPTFMGALPNVIPKTKESGIHAGKRVLPNHIVPALKLINDLSAKQRSKATLVVISP